MREVCEDPCVMDAVDFAGEKWRRAEDAWSAAVWVIARDPQAGRPLHESGRVRAIVFQGAHSIGMPTIEIIYENTYEKLVVRWVEFTNAKASVSGAV